MKTRLLIIIVGIIIAVFLLVAVVYPTMNYQTWGNNELSYTPFTPGTKIVCDEWLWQPPQNCKSEYIITDTESEKEGVCDPGPILEYGDCYKDGKKIVFKSETESKELECLRLYKDIREISRTDGMALAEREIIDMHKNVVFEYVEKNCPDFPDLEFIYNNYNQNISEPDLELSVGGKINFGKSFTIHAWLPTYENQNDVQYMVSVLDPEGNQVDSTIWFAKQDFVYLFDTTHPAYNITKSVTYSIQVEKTEKLQRTGIIYKSLQLDVIYPIQENQNEN